MARFTKYTPSLAAAVAALILAAGAAAQSEPRRGDRPPPPPGERRGGGELRGPAVRDDRAPGAVDGFVPGGERRMVMGERIPPRVFLDAVRSLNDDKLPADVRATPEQVEKLTAMGEAFRAQREDYMKQHADELKRLREEAGVRRPGGPDGGPGAPRGEGRPGGPRPDDRRPADADDMSPPDQAKRERARARIREIEQAAPKFEDAHTKMWAELSESQRKHVESRLAEFREQGAKQREDQYVRQRLGQRAGPEKGAAPGPNRDAGPDRGDLCARRDRMIRLFEQLPPEEQERILARLEERVADRAGPDRPQVDRKPEPGADAPRPQRRRVREGGPTPPPPPPKDD